MSPIALSADQPNGGAPASALLQQLYAAPDAQACAAAAQALSEHVARAGVRSLAEDGITDDLVRAAKSKSGYERESSMVALEQLARKLATVGGADPYLVPLLPVILDRYQEAGKGDVVKDAAERAAKQIVRMAPPEVAPRVIDQLFEVVEGNAKWRSKVGALQLIATFATSAKEQVAERLGEYVPRLTGSMRDTKAEVANTASKTGITLCSVLTNPDIQPFVPTLVKCMADPTTVPEAIKRLSSTVWVREVDAPTLAVVVPLLLRALGDRGTIVQRQTVVLISNLFKLVRSPDLAALHAQDILPGVTRIKESASFPEIRAFADESQSAIIKAQLGARVPAIDHMSASREDAKTLRGELDALVSKDKPVDTFAAQSLDTVAFAVAQLVRKRVFGEKPWTETYVTPYLRHFVTEDTARAIALELLKRWVAIDAQRFQIETGGEDDDEGEILVDLPFSLAYGGLLLLNHTTLKLRRGHRYGVCGANGAGKSTLLKAINRKQIENFPETISAAYVEHDIDGDDSGVTVLGLMLAEQRIKVDEKEIRELLLEYGFDEERQHAAISSLSGGWKMKVALARAMLMKVDVLLLDEPTNHLDVEKIAWLENYLKSQTQITSLIVSHDSGFLDNVCTNIIHYHQKQLVYYTGNLSHFVEKYPAAQSYYTLSASVVKFTFPPPGSLMGVRSRTRAILKMTDCTFTYPGRDKPQLRNASVAVSMSSRIGVVGPNGAGKSTLIKLLTGETVPDSGKVEKHPNLRIAYVAQHAFHHIEEHLDKTAVQYIMWRFQMGTDKEQALKASRLLTPEEQRVLDTPIVSKTTGESRKLEQIVGRQKHKKSYMYEIKFQGYDHRFNAQIDRERLMELGFTKLVQEFDDYEAAREGAGSREISVKLVRQHLEDVGLNGDIAEYNDMAGLSGGQKVKVVIAAAMWSKPQMLVLDEPTNFLDRDALGGLAIGIREWPGAFVAISHNREFISALCSEIWNVEDGVIHHKGKAAVDESGGDSGVPSAAASAAASAVPSRADTPVSATPANSTPAGSGDERPSVDSANMSFKAAKGKKKMTRKEMKAREERRRLRTLAFLSSSIPGAVREPDTESEDEGASGTSTPASKSGTSTPSRRK